MHSKTVQVDSSCQGEDTETPERVRRHCVITVLSQLMNNIHKYMYTNIKYMDCYCAFQALQYARVCLLHCCLDVLTNLVFLHNMEVWLSILVVRSFHLP